jgi:gluconokinase
MTPQPPPPTGLIVMGVSGCGKTTVGEGLAERLGWPFRDGDGFHPPENVEKMRSGTPLTDDDRWPWLDAIAAWLDERRRGGGHGIVACSALRRVYRERLRAGHDDVRFVFLDGDRAVIEARLKARKGHYMPPSLLDSQLATLERPGPDEPVVTVDVAPEPEAIVADALNRLGLTPATAA